MGYTVVGLFRHSGDAEMAADHLREEHVLYADDLDIIGEAEWENLTPPAPEGGSAWALAAFTGIGLAGGRADAEPLGKRWIDKLWQGETLVVARSADPEAAEIMAGELREMGAERVDIISV